MADAVQNIDIALAEAELKALRAQLNPHFIFNTLVGVHSMLDDRDLPKVREYLRKLACLTRMTLEFSERGEVTVGEELEWIRSYLSLEKERFEERLDYRVILDASVDPDIPVPALLLQPYVENAIKHGISHRERGGKVEVCVRPEGEYLLFSVTDNGPGRGQVTPDYQEYIPLGCRISKKRVELLRKLYGNDLYVSVRDLEIKGLYSSGTRVEIGFLINNKPLINSET